MQSVFRIIIYCIPFLLVSCIQDYTIDYNNSQNILTLNAEINHLQPAEVLIALPKKPNQLGDYFTPSDAEVILYENGNFFEQLTFKPSTDTSFGVYISKKNISEGNSYTIEATYRDLPVISAHQKVPAEPEISNIFLGKDFSEINDIDTLPVKITFVPNDTTSKYVAVYSYLDVDMEMIDEFGDSSMQNYEYRLEAFDEGGNGFRDYKHSWVKILPASNEFNFNVILNFFDSIQSENIQSVQLVFIISALTEEGYQYRKTYLDRNKDNYGEPSIVYSNIQNGLGIFSAKASVRQKFRIK